MALAESLHGWWRRALAQGQGEGRARRQEADQCRGAARDREAYSPGEAQAWLAKHPRFKLHFTPTSSSWINLVERLFAEITRQQIRRGVFKSVAELEAAIETWLTERNAKPKPFKWTAKANIILEKNARAKRALEEDLAAGTK